MRVCIVGGAGNMGRRYQAICRSENIPYDIMEVDHNFIEATHYVIATPTNTHREVVEDIVNEADKRNFIADFLIEKPVQKISKSPDEELQWLVDVESQGHSVWMVNQYAYYSSLLDDREGPTYYDFYHSGTDGIQWDCIQLIHLARSGIKYLRDDSPTWEACINGVKLSRELIDFCYVKMILDFISGGNLYGKLWGVEEIKTAHYGVVQYERGFNRYTGEINIR